MLGIQRAVYCVSESCLPKMKSFSIVVSICAAALNLKSPGRNKIDHISRSDLPPLFPRYNIAPSQSVLESFSTELNARPRFSMGSRSIVEQDAN